MGVRFSISLGMMLTAAVGQATARAQTAVTLPAPEPVSRGNRQGQVSVLYAADYGESLPAGDKVKLWWCDATRKVSRDRPVPRPSGTTVTLEAARNDFEAAQLVVRPERPLVGLTVSIGDLDGPGSAKIPKSEIELLRVDYLAVRVPTDAMGVADDWPDPLPPLTQPLDVPAGTNQPIWILVHVPQTAIAGDYRGAVTLSAERFSASVPLRLHVWDFTLPEEPRTHSAFGLSLGTVYRYHGIRDEADRRVVCDKYMQSFSDHRISPYNPTPYDPIQIKFISDTDPPRAEVNFDCFDAAMQRAVNRRHITSFMLRIPGMGGGTFHSRHEGKIAGHGPDSPEYKAMFSSAVRQIEGHLREKGWLDKAYVYWFDEPTPRDYDFVRAGMARLRKYAPGLRRMLTEEPVEPLFGAVDLWCPIAHHYDHEAAEKRRQKGEQFWWYVCTGPKAPYCTLFIDHPATDLRVWLWQTWQRKIEGILVWQSTYWTSGAAFPDSLQNPYEDPMGYKSGYSTPKGTKAYWGNGDGRFLYPPEAAAAGSERPVLEGPVSSIRWEMLREGIEDVDCLHLLAAAIEANTAGADAEVLTAAKALLEVPAEITASMTEYTFDPAPIYERRRAVAEMIERLTGARVEG